MLYEINNNLFFSSYSKPISQLLDSNPTTGEHVLKWLAPCERSTILRRTGNCPVVLVGVYPYELGYYKISATWLEGDKYELGWICVLSPVHGLVLLKIVDYHNITKGLPDQDKFYECTKFMLKEL